MDTTLISIFFVACDYVLQLQLNLSIVKMLKLLNAENIFEAFRPLHRYSRIFGLTAFGIEGNEGKNRKAKISVWNCVHVLLVCIYAMMQSVNFILNYEETVVLEGVEMTKVITIALNLLSVTFCFSMASISVVTLIGRNSIVNVLNLIEDVDRELRHLGYRVNYRKHTIIFFFAVTIWNLMHIISVYITYFTSFSTQMKLDIIAYFSIVFCLQFLFAFHFQFVLVIWFIKKRFKLVNDFFCASFSSASTSPNICGSHRIKMKNLNLVARLHELLVMASECFSEGFGVAVSCNHVIFFFRFKI